MRGPLSSEARTVIRRYFKTCVNILFLVFALMPAVLSAFGRLKPVYTFFAHASATLPGAPGDYFQGAFYRLTLAEFHLSSRVSFGSFFAHPQARVGRRVYVGSYTVLGMVILQDGVQIASGVQILSGNHQHRRSPSGTVHHAGEFITVTIAEDVWIGAAAIVMADVGARTTVGAGSVVTHAIPPDVVAMGNPARVVGWNIASPSTAVETKNA